MDRILIEQNPWWEDKNSIEKDKQLQEYSKALVKFPLPNFIFKHGLYIIRGPRQVGKTTLLKTIIREKLKTLNPEQIFYFSAESGVQLENAIREYLDFAGEQQKFLFIDEATEDKKWATKIKYLIDNGKITKNDSVLITGSSSVDLKLGSERLPGRFVEGNEYLFYPYSFREYNAFAGPTSGLENFSSDSAKKLSFSEVLRKKLPLYVKNGGLPPVWNIDRELAKERYARWVEGVIAKNNRSILYARELLTKLGEKTVFDFFSLAKETSIKSHHTVESYLSFFEAGMFGKLLYNYNLSINAPDPKKEKKFFFIDPFLIEVFSSRREESLIIEDLVGSHLLRACDKLYFYRDKKSEIDFLCQINKELIPVEVKWKNKLKESDAFPLRKFGKGFIITKDEFAVFDKIIAVPAFVFLSIIGKSFVKRQIL